MPNPAVVAWQDFAHVWNDNVASKLREVTGLSNPRNEFEAAASIAPIGGIVNFGDKAIAQGAERGALRFAERFGIAAARDSAEGAASSGTREIRTLVQGRGPRFFESRVVRGSIAVGTTGVAAVGVGFAANQVANGFVAVKNADSERVKVNQAADDARTKDAIALTREKIDPATVIGDPSTRPGAKDQGGLNDFFGGIESVGKTAVVLAVVIGGIMIAASLAKKGA